MKKTVRRTKNYHVHDQANRAKVGDIVSIQESRPHSKLKTWELVSEAGGEEGHGILSGVVSTVKSVLGLSTES